jgi:nucleoside phosphorylase
MTGEVSTGPVDVLIVAALPEEFDAARAVGTAASVGVPGVPRWTECGTDGPLPFLFGEYRVSGRGSLSVALARPVRTGGRTVGPFTASLVDVLRPRCLAMCGVCAGDPDETVLGDVVVAEVAYEWDEGKLTGGRFAGDHRQVPLDPRWLRAAQDFDPCGLPSHGPVDDYAAKRWLLECLERGQEPRRHPGRDRYLRPGRWQRLLGQLEDDGLVCRDGDGVARLTRLGRGCARRSRYDDVDGPGRLPFAVRVAPMASGSAVVADRRVWETLRAMGVRKVAAVEMEAATIATVAHERRLQWLVAKGVMDHADQSKDDRCKAFAARASAEVMYALLTKLVPPRASAYGSAGAPRPAANPSTVPTAPAEAELVVMPAGVPRGHGRLLRTSSTLAVLAAAVTALAWASATGSVSTPTTVGGLVALIAASGSLLWLRHRENVTGAETMVTLAVLLESVARWQREQWSAEETARQVQDPWPLPVRWKVTARAEALMVSWGAVTGRPAALPLPLEGTYDAVADVFTAPGSPRRLVVIGEPGAGKSMLALRLVLDLLNRRTATDPVPVLLPVAAWNPRQPLDDWIADALTAANRALGREIPGPRGQRSIARALVAAGRILPILDGLDEMAADHQGAALNAVTVALGADRQFVLTSRTRHYEQIVAMSGRLARTPVVEIQPLYTADVATYLTDGTDPPHARWTPVTEHLRARVNTPLTAALSTPLMAWLTRVVYRSSTADPLELLTAGWAGSRDGIEQHLLRELVPSVYRVAIGPYPARSPHQIDRVDRWLTTIAGHLNRHRIYDLAWWHLRTVASPTGLGTLAAAVSGSCIAVVLFAALSPTDTRLARAFVGALIGGFIASGVFFVVRHNTATDAAPPAIATRLPLRQLLYGIAVGAVVCSPFWFAEPVVAPLGITLIVSTFFGAIASVLAILFTDSGETTATPRRLARDARRTSLAIAAIMGLPFGTFFGVSTYSMYTPVKAAILGIAFGTATAVTVLLAMTEWGIFGLARVLLAVRRRTPLRLIGFLTEAHQRGILRQAGGFYQFRHNRLQDQLAEPAGQASRPSGAR